MKEHPILFSGDMIRALLDGRKTQTRRPIKPQPKGYGQSWGEWLEPGDVYYDAIARRLRRAVQSRGRNKRESGELTPVDLRCPYGQPGDRLVMLCTWAAPKKYDKVKPSRLPNNVRIWTLFDGSGKPDWCGRPRPGRFMPKWMRSRMPRAEITEVRVQLVQDISEEDARAEGMTTGLCQKVLARAAGKLAKEYSDCCYVVDKDGNDRTQGYQCYDCAVKFSKKHKGSQVCDAGCAESDGPAYCDDCYAPLCMSLTEHGVERELFMEVDEPSQSHYVASGLDAAIAAMLSDGYGCFDEAKHGGRLAQIGFATLWDSINGKKAPWASNPWVWVITFKVVP